VSGRNPSLRQALRDVVAGFVQFFWSLVCGGALRYGWSARMLVVTPDFVMRERGRDTAPPKVVRCHACIRGHSSFGGDVVYATPVGTDRIEVVRFADRGVTWCYGWREEDAQALHALAALEHSR